MPRLVVDMECNAETFWDTVHAMEEGDRPALLNRLLETFDTDISGSAAEVAEVLAWAAQIPGWNDPDAPAFAPHPLLRGR